MFCARCKVKLFGVADAAAHVTVCVDPRWKEVVEAKLSGGSERASKIVRRILGVKGPEMPAETKEKLREYAREHAEEIKAKRAQRALVRRRIREMSKPVARVRKT